MAKNVKTAVNFFIMATIVAIIVTIITYFINPNLEEVMQGIENGSSSQITESTGIAKIWPYIVNNGFAVPFQMFILALIPVQFLYLVNIISTNLLLGILFGIALRMEVGTGIDLILSTIPHYTFEIFAYCLFAATLFEINKAVRVTMKNIFKKDKEKNTVISKLLQTVRIYIVIVLPLIIVAAFLETYAADLIFEILQ